MGGEGVAYGEGAGGVFLFFFSSRRRHTRCYRDWSSDVCSSDLSTSAPPAATYLGFDRNEYPGDENLATLRRTFSYASYWLNAPPRATSNTWFGHRRAVEAAGFG